MQYDPETSRYRGYLNRARPSRRAADPAVKGNVQAAQGTLVGADDKLLFVDKIEADPEIVRQSFTQNAVNGRHLQDHVTLAR